MFGDDRDNARLAQARTFLTHVITNIFSPWPIFVQVVAAWLGLILHAFAHTAGCANELVMHRMSSADAVLTLPLALAVVHAIFVDHYGGGSKDSKSLRTILKLLERDPEHREQ